jgi:uracil phosphoribosyltransferase
MIATGGTASAAIAALKQWSPRLRIKVLSVVASRQGIRLVLGEHPDCQIYVAAVDEQLDDDGSIVPGLGDAGGRLFRTQ